MEFIDFALRNWYLFAALVVILSLLIGTEVLRKLRGITSANPTQVTQLINHDSAVVLDIRDTADYKIGHIPQSYHIPYSELKQRVNEIKKFQDKPIVVCCRSGNQSMGAGNLLRKAGFGNIRTLRGGIAAWQSANLPLSKK